MQQQNAEENPQLRAEQFVVNEGSPADRRGEEEGHFSLGERERGALVRNDPRQDDNNEQDEGASQLDKLLVFRRNCRAAAGSDRAEE